MNHSQIEGLDRGHVTGGFGAKAADESTELQRTREETSLFWIREQDQGLVCCGLRDKTSDECNLDLGSSYVTTVV